MRWTAVIPQQVKRSFRDHPWVFAYAMESPDERDDGLWYHGLLFRDADRTVFGGFEIISPTITVPEFERRYDIRSIAAKIVRNKDYRESLIAEDERIADLWKRH